ncbi:excalibur calcium-binding domain-containing protein [Rodentibacter caecimuris]|nr:MULTISPECIES: excalibur calcium-binding domain-containing protein [Pasteurellaceae]MCQ9124445.1 excalibur calcium-binding domain-containing protein [Rodentibacter heylii]MCR1837583.1 excalibur calcium-binding domain-containing protein [Pasteurella caecimuris]MCU0107092.1 excalibur calcium-binding domain-containing protein [Pasteurella caecimuris]
MSSSYSFAKARCSDFSTQEEAQAYMVRYGATYLDRDRDGEACECLPGGSKYGSSVCKRR